MKNSDKKAKAKKKEKKKERKKLEKFPSRANFFASSPASSQFSGSLTRKTNF